MGEGTKRMTAIIYLTILAILQLAFIIVGVVFIFKKLNLMLVELKTLKSGKVVTSNDQS